MKKTKELNKIRNKDRARIETSRARAKAAIDALNAIANKDNGSKG